ncbi:hypothetical protein NM688_g8970 [Phlebia brevispora]|uniref:Uncharacterized protein n=1 Tax=Phlebia brevispora TaxID=194682 RepID=A0ACC1RL02_9APHY|nr:hypothetical protein NM688_g8970 [Phlebia brevispora]
MLAMQLPEACSEPAVKKTKILAGKLFDPYSLDFLENRLITVSEKSGLIVDVQPFDHLTGIVLSRQPDVVDLRKQTVLPGFVDAHVHFFLHPYSEVTWEDQVTRENLTERTVRAVVHAKRTLMAGYTAVRDLGTEGAEDADITLRKCLSGPNPMVPGPRYFTANRAIVTTGSYGPKNRLYPNRDGVEGVTGAEVADGESECRRAVRRQVGAGADWIKVIVSLRQRSFITNGRITQDLRRCVFRYRCVPRAVYAADYRARARIADADPITAGRSFPTFTESELEAVVSEAHRLGVKVAAHASTSSSWTTLHAINHRVDTIEHAYEIGELFDETTRPRLSVDPPLRSKGTAVWVPTLATYYTVGQTSGVWEKAAKTFKTVLAHTDPKDLAIACGGDTGVFAHGDNALEMKVMVRLGADWRLVLRWATLGGWQCLRSMRWEGEEGLDRLNRVEELGEDARVVGDNEVPFGAVRKGFAADIIATNGDFAKDFEGAVDKASISFVMKGAAVCKLDGRELV